MQKIVNFIENSKKIVFILLLCCILGVFSFQNCFLHLSFSFTSPEQDQYIYPLSNSFHPPIYINGNDWTQCDVVTGNGTLTDPYIIANLTIDAGGEIGIKIENSESYGIIQNCTILNAHVGIHIYMVSNCEVQSNSLENIPGGISSHYCRNSRFVNNIIVNNSICGIYLNDLRNSTVEKNLLFNSRIVLGSSSNNIIQENNIIHALGTGIELGSSTNNILIDNVITNSSCGIAISSSSYNILSRNLVSNNLLGIYLEYSNNCSINGNSLENNEYSGLKMSHASFNTVNENNISYSLNGIFISDSNSSFNLVYYNILNNTRKAAIQDYGLNNDIHDNYIYNENTEETLKISGFSNSFALITAGVIIFQMHHHHLKASKRKKTHSW